MILSAKKTPSVCFNRVNLSYGIIYKTDLDIWIHSEEEKTVYKQMHRNYSVLEKDQEIFCHLIEFHCLN